MREIRIYQAGHYRVGDDLLLEEGAAQHVGVVLRMKPGESLTLFNGRNEEFAAQIREIRKKKVLVTILSMQAISRESPMAIHLIPAVIKGERMEWLIQKAVELGVQQISPVITDYCSVKQDTDRWAKKQQQWQAIAIAACEQSERNKIPLVQPIQPLMRLLPSLSDALKLCLHPVQAKSWRGLPPIQDSVTVLIGPEGGLSELEVAALEKENFITMSLGPRILRAETAAVATLTLLQHLGGDLV